MFLGILLLLSLVFPLAQADRNSAVVNAADGVPIQYSVQGKGDTALVFVHCWACDRTYWDNQVAEFAKNYRVVTIDLPGHGQSGQGRKTWSIPSFGEDVKAVVTKLDLKRVVLIGSSMGGPISLEAARAMPDRVVAIVPVDSLLNVEQKIAPEQLDAIIKQMQADYKATITGLTNQFFFSPNTPAAVKERVLKDSTSRPPELAIAIMKGILSYDVAPTFRETKVPIHAINGDRAPTNLEANRKYAPQFDASIIKGSGHYPMLENPAGFNQALAEILKKLPPAK
ncbi:MAG TPA: alpha/beta hydrolase [Pyrinomonadaceae bacterium]|nr:alpha/beta hydrolase [Pyrinomonadaceae bacterium]